MEIRFILISRSPNHMDNVITMLFRSSQTVFTRRELAILWNETNPGRLGAKISYYCRRGNLKKITRGIYARDLAYDTKELATSIYIPSYISFETVLREAGVIFQHYETIFIATKRTRDMTLDSHSFTFRKLKDIVLYSPIGIISKETYSTATVERAFLDMIYLFPNMYFDNLEPINWVKCHDIVHIYQNKQLEARLISYQKEYAK